MELKSNHVIDVHLSEITMVPVGELKPHPKNPNRHSPEQLDRLAKILQYQGWRYPIKVSKRTGYITSGHGRLEAAVLMGLGEVPVSYQDYKDEDQEWADVVADNAIASWSHLDLSAINSSVADLGPDFDLDLLGIRDFVLDAPKHALKDVSKPEAEKKYLLEVEMASEEEMIEVYDDLLSRGLIVRVKNG